MSTVSIDAHSPAHVAQLVARAGVGKGNMRLDKVFFSSFSAGCLLAFACGTLLSTNTTVWFQENAPGLIRTISALVFPYGLCMIILTGADLCTGSFMYTTVAALQRQLPWYKMLLHCPRWQRLRRRPLQIRSHRLRHQETTHPDFHHIFLRGIGCNWLVCVAVFLGTQGRDLASKLVGIWFPIFAFVSLGFDHVVANMTFIPMGIWLGAPNITVGLYIWKGIIPTLLGNIIGGGLFVGTYYWYMYLLSGEVVSVTSLRESGMTTPRSGDVEAVAADKRN
ncbi:hypothetical protein CNMCM5793_001029 [Aspergillus hiratsukae]|uniref:Formate/nitrite transporter n=1 Tax=Aspergillus hiratsukae TaxID=1194566 RepID=A0A8H6PBC8_9EURO|nr:hypothetical protein CNMCM5793_001029 [Aspergillus hiratsukae]